MIYDFFASHPWWFSLGLAVAFATYLVCVWLHWRLIKDRMQREKWRADALLCVTEINRERSK